jgi:hypothetical protein
MDKENLNATWSLKFYYIMIGVGNSIGKGITSLHSF